MEVSGVSVNLMDDDDAVLRSVGDDGCSLFFERDTFFLAFSGYTDVSKTLLHSAGVWLGLVMVRP